MSASTPPNFANLETATLKRYKRIYRLNCENDRDSLVAAVTKHFRGFVLVEAKVLSRFADTVKRRRMTDVSPQK